jgi:hypothetical protein
MKIELEDYIETLHLPSHNFLKNDKRNKKLYFQSFSSELIFKRSIETLKFSLKNQYLSVQKNGKNRELQKIFSEMSVNFNYNTINNFIPKIIYWDQNKQLGFYEICN